MPPLAISVEEKNPLLEKGKTETEHLFNKKLLYIIITLSKWYYFDKKK